VVHQTARRVLVGRWTAALSAPVGKGSLVVAGRAAFFLAFWLMISGWALADLPVGLAAVIGATWVSLRFLPPLGSRYGLAAIASVVASFFRQSVVSGTDVAWRALSPSLKLEPGLVACPLRLPAGGKRSAFCALSSLMPGTLPTGTDEQGALLVHCLDMRQPADLAAEEQLFIRAFGGD
jgi:multicomponent Na+:H+ antiporter subunit E